MVCWIFGYIEGGVTVTIIILLLDFYSVFIALKCFRLLYVSLLLF